MRRAAFLGIGAAASLVAGCPSFGTFECRDDDACNRGGFPPGQCLPDGACAYEDDACPSGLRRSPYATTQAGECAEVVEASTSTSTSAVTEPQRITAGEFDCQRGFAFRRELEVVTDAAVAEGYSLAVEIDHAALVQAGDAAADGNDVRVFTDRDGCPGVELDRVADPRIGWNTSATRIWFAAPDDIAEGETLRGLYLYYGNADASEPPADYDAVFELGSDFDGDTLPAGLQASTNPPGALAVGGGTLRMYYETLDIAAAAIVALAEPLPDDNRFEFVNRARLVSGEATESNMKYFTMVGSAQPPLVADHEVEHARRIVSAQHLTNNEQGIGYVGTDGAELSWDGDAWVVPSVFWGDAGLGTYTTHALVSSPDAFHIVASDDDGTVLTTTEPVPWSAVRVPEGPRWLYMGEVFVDYYVCVAEYDWFFLRRTLEVEPLVLLGDVETL